MSWFDVDRDGLAAILERRGKSFAVAEIVSNAWDSGTDRCEVRLTPIAGQPYATLEVEDWGEGFADPKEAFTMFGKSRRAADASKRGRFALGEKLVLAICRRAEIVTVGWQLSFEPGSKPRLQHRSPRETGTLFHAEIRMTREEFDEVCRTMRRLIPPVPTTFNGITIERLSPVVTFRTKLPTEIGGEDGVLRRSVGMADVEVYESGGVGEILELGVPVVETGNGYRVNVLAKVPLNMDRDNVPPAFLRAVEVAMLNALKDQITPEQASEAWAQQAVGDARATPEAVRATITKRFGERCVIATPGDPMANAQAEANGYTVVPGGALSGAAWANVKKAEIMLPTSKVFPSMTPAQRAGAAEAAADKCPMCGRAL